MHLLNYFDDEAYRSRILVQLNRGEARHMLARAVFHGKRAELRQRYRQGQEDQLHAPGTRRSRRIAAAQKPQPGSR